MKQPFAKFTAVLVTAAGFSLIPFDSAEAALIRFSYQFDNGIGNVTGTVEGDVGADGFSVTNLSNLDATFTGLNQDADPSNDVTFDVVLDTPNPIFSLTRIVDPITLDAVSPTINSIEESVGDGGDPDGPNVLFSFSNVDFNAPGFTPGPEGIVTFFVNSFARNDEQRANVAGFTPDVGAGSFGTFSAELVPDDSGTSVPEPTTVLGTLVVAGALAPRFMKRRAA